MVVARFDTVAVHVVTRNKVTRKFSFERLDSPFVFVIEDNGYIPNPICLRLKLGNVVEVEAQLNGQKGCRVYFGDTKMLSIKGPMHLKDESTVVRRYQIELKWGSDWDLAKHVINKVIDWGAYKNELVQISLSRSL